MTNDSTRASLELLYNVSRELASALELRTVLQSVLSLSLANVGGERGSIVVLDDQGQPVDAAIVYKERILTHTTQQLRSTVDHGLAGWVVRSGQAVLVPNTSRDERWLQRPDDAADRSGPKSAICVPLRAREKLVGVLTVVHPQPGFFNPDHLSLIRAIADQAGIAILNGRLYDESQRQARVMTALAENAVSLNASLRLEEVLQRILEQTQQALGVEVVALGLVEATDKEIVFRAASGTGGQELLGLRAPLGEGMLGRVIANGRPVIGSAPLSPQAFPATRLAVRELACAAVRAHGENIGVLAAVNPPAGGFFSDAVQFLNGIGSLAGTAIHNAQLYERLEATHQRYRELFDDSIDPILITDWSGSILEANRRAMTDLGLQPGALDGLTIQQIHQVDEEHLGADFSSLEGGETVAYESTLQAPGGRAIPVQVYVHTVSFEDAQNLQWILRDISERKALEEMREDLLAMIYHDLRSPLANVVSSLEVLGTLLPPDSNPAIPTVLNIASRSTDRIRRLVNSLLDTRRLEAGQPIANRQEAAPEALLRDAVDVIRQAAESKQQVLQAQVEGELPALWIDADMIRRVLINLLENASKFTPAGGSITAGAHRQADAVAFWVEDSGPGIPVEERERIFNKFTRLQVEGGPKGLGLGLAFCRLAVQAHGGTIWVEGAPAQGSRFEFTIPLRPAEA